MSARDVFRFINDLDEATTENIINRLEFRGKDPTFSRMRDAYLERLGLATAVQVLELGCGTGVVARALAQRGDFSGRVLGVDQSPALIAAASRLAEAEGVGGRVAFRVADAHALDVPDNGFDAVIAHTLVSHVTDPVAVLKEAARAARPGGKIAIFDGDYASLTFGYSNPVLGKAMEEGLVTSIVNNPRVLRDLPRLLRQAGLELVEAQAQVFAEVGTGTFFAGFAEAYAPLVARMDLLSQAQVDAWLAEQRRALQDGTFFAACNYYSYIVRRSGA